MALAAPVRRSSPARLRTPTHAVAALAALQLSCAGALQPGSEATTARFERSVGTGSAPDLMTISTRVVRQNNFEIYKEDGAPRIYIETRWKDRYPFDDEQMLGATKAQTRLILRGTAHGSTPLGPLSLYEGEHTVQLTRGEQKERRTLEITGEEPTELEFSFPEEE